MARWLLGSPRSLRSQWPKTQNATQNCTEWYSSIRIYKVQHDVQHMEREDIRRIMNFWTRLSMRFHFCPTSKHSLCLKNVAATFCERCIDCQEVSLISSQFGQRFNEYVRVAASVWAMSGVNLEIWMCKDSARLLQLLSYFFWVLNSIETHWNNRRCNCWEQHSNL